MDADVVWQGIGANVVGAILGGVAAVLSALWVVRLTNRGAAQNARQERLEAAQAELIQAVSAISDPQLSLSVKRDRDARAEWAPRFAQARVRILLLTGSDDLDDCLQKVPGEWETQWRRLRDYLAHYQGEDAPDMTASVLGESRPPTDDQVGRARERVQAMAEDLGRRLRDLHEPSRDGARQLIRSLDEWHGRLTREAEAWPSSSNINQYRR